jgi:hypothetical protein
MHPIAWPIPHFLRSGPFFGIISFLQPATNTYLLVPPHIKQSRDRPQKDLAQFGREVESCYFSGDFIVSS